MLQRQTVHHGDAEECVGTYRRQEASSGRYSRPFARDGPCIETSAMVHSDEPVHNTCAARTSRNSRYVPQETRRQQVSFRETATTDQMWARGLHHSTKYRASRKTPSSCVEDECNSGHDRRLPSLRRVPLRRHTHCRGRNLPSRNRWPQMLACATCGRHVVFAFCPLEAWALQDRALICGAPAHNTQTH